MINSNYFKKLILIFTLILAVEISCSTKRSVKYVKKPVLPGTNIAVIINTPDNLKNVVLYKFLNSGYNVSAVNASDFYSLDDIFDIKDMKKLSYSVDAEDSIVSMERTYDNAYKLHIYNFEVNKAEILNELKNRWKVQYLVLIDLQNWQDISWGRAINLNSFEIVWIENYPTRYTDNIETVIDHFIASMSGK